MASVTTAPGIELARARLADSISVKQAMLDDDAILAQAVVVAEVIVAALRAGNKVLFFGNGGSSMDAGHLAAELTGRFAYDRPGLAAFSISDSTAAVTAIGNDYSYADVYSRQVLGLGKAGDVVVGLSTSGTSANVVKALEVARGAGMTTVALTGESGGACVDVAQHCLRVPSRDTARVQEACLHLGHIVCEIVEATIFPAERARESNGS